mgnify:FL=1
MKSDRILLYIIMLALCALVFPKVSKAQVGQRYLDPVFDEVTTTEAIPFSSAIREGQTTPTTLYLDFYEPAGDTMAARPLVITVFGGAFVTGSRDFVDMVAYCTRLAQLGYATASIDYRLLSLLQVSGPKLIRDAYMAAQDVSSAIRYFKLHSEDYRIDPEHIYLLGNSAGSIAILGEMFIGEEERPAETFEAPDLGSLHSSGYSEYADFSPQVAGAVAHWGAVLSLDMIDYDEYTPICMIHGTDDTMVPFDSGYCFASYGLPYMPYMYGSQAIAMHLEDMGITDFEFHPFEGEDHAFYLSASYLSLDEEKFSACFDIVRNFLWNHLDPSLSVADVPMTELSVYPNPATQTIVIRGDALSQNGQCRIAISDVNGRELFAQDASQPNVTIDVSGWPSGIYLVRFEQNGRYVSRKFVKR